MLRCRFGFIMVAPADDGGDANEFVGVEDVELDDEFESVGFLGISKFSFDLSIIRSCSRLLMFGREGSVLRS